MNSISPPNRVVAVRPVALPARTKHDREFLPAALEILDTPASPTQQVLLVVICLMFVAAFAWACVAKLDIYAVATGRIQASGRSKIIQPLEAGKVSALLVQNGAEVKAGDPLIELDSTEAKAELTAQQGNLESLDGEIARRLRAIQMVRGTSTDPNIPFPDDVGPLVKAREQAAMQADLLQYASTRDSQLAEVDEKRATKQRLALTIGTREKLVASLVERVEMKDQLTKTSSGTRAAVLDALQQSETEQTNLAYDRGQMIETDAAIVTLQQKLVQLTAEFVATQSDKLNEAQHKRDQGLQDTIKAGAKSARTHLTAPIDGMVQQLAVTTVGQVVTPGEPLLLIVPDQGPVEIEATVLNRDIGFLEAGQDAIVKIDAFPFTRYGTMKGTVLHVSRDAIDDRDNQGSKDVSSIAKGQGLAPSTGEQPTTNLVFQVTVALDKTTFFADGRNVPLTPGMTTSVEIRTGERRVIDFLLSPLRETSSTAGHER